jgi:glycosyltransferase involved in cell wall biosynthesis
LEVRDIWPESIGAVGAMQNGLLLRTLCRLERWMYRAADRIVTVGHGYRENILSKVDAGGRIHVITNGVDLSQFVPADTEGRFRNEWGLNGRFICSYVGTIGMAHGLEVVLEAARRLNSKGRRDIAFCLVGDGAQRAKLEKDVRAAGLQDMVVFAGLQPKEAIPCVLASSDACLIHLKKCDLFTTVIPSKIFETMAAAKPIIMGVEGESRAIVLSAGSGLPMEPGSAVSLVQAVEQLADDPKLAARCGQQGRAFVAEHYSRDVLAAEYLRVLTELAEPIERNGSKSPAIANTSIEEVCGSSSKV